MTLPQMFRQAGYNTTGSGKIFHPGQFGSNNADIDVDGVVVVDRGRGRGRGRGGATFVVVACV